LDIKIPHYQTGGGTRPSLRCPSCRQIGTFEPLNNIPDVQVPGSLALWLGQKRCPNTKCFAHVFVVLNPAQMVLRSYPAERIDFDSANIPPAIVRSLEEALTCHAEECFVASAIMVRRTLEEVCQDKAAQGANLRDRIGALRSKVVLPGELFSAMDELRILGNDAAHIEAKSYNGIGKEEMDVAIALTKEILKAVYQLDNLVKRLQALKKP
jgi:hypothetical protein